MLLKNCEIVFLSLWDVGQAIDLDIATEIVSGIRRSHTLLTKDTPHEIVLPSTLQFELIHKTEFTTNNFSEIKIQAKLYQDGVISFLTRVQFAEISLESFHTVRNLKITLESKSYSIDEWIDLQYTTLKAKIQHSFNIGLYKIENIEPERYTFFCIRDPSLNPEDFVANNRKYLASLLIGENPDLKLHSNIITRCLQNPFNFLENDCVIFDTDRALILDPYCDYEDIILITELANYQLLELRVLDEVLNRWQKIAENEINALYRTKKPLKGSKMVRLEAITKVRYDAVFILDSIQNVSKIIGDYFLAQIYTHLCSLLQLDQWIASIRQRVDLLSEIYGLANQNRNESRVLYLEVLMAVFFFIEVIMVIFDYL